MNPPYVLRDECAADAATIADLTRLAFAPMAYSSGTESRIIDALRAAGALTLSLVVEAGGHVVGHAAYSPITLSDGAGGWFVLGPISVLPEWQRKGIGTALIQEGFRRLQRAGAAGCVVVGDPKYYGRLGFVHDPALTLEGVPPEVTMARRLTANSDGGKVQLHAAFAVA